MCARRGSPTLLIDGYVHMPTPRSLGYTDRNTTCSGALERATDPMTRPMSQRILYINAPRRERINGTWSVSAEVEGQLLWFECNHAKLAVRPEAFLTAFFIPALHTSARLTIDAAVDPGWVEQTRQLLPIYNRWWDYRLEHPVTRVRCTNRCHDSAGSGEENVVAQCFTGGIDSFYSLLRGTHCTQHLLYVYGYDIPLEDRRRFRDLEDTLHAIAEATGRTPIVVRTNLRKHDLFRRVSWERTHGAALAAVGLLLENKITSLVIPSSYAYEHETPWGSHWDTDPLWARPAGVDIVHDHPTSRRDKIFEIASVPLVQRHLRVCWQNLAPTGNCSRCEKCLRTMTTLEVCGHLHDYHRVFDTRTSLHRLLDGLRRIPPQLIFVWEDLATRNVSPPTRAAIQRLLRRSKLAAHLAPVKPAYRRLRSLLTETRDAAVRLLFRASNES